MGPRLMPMLSMATMAMATTSAMPTMDTDTTAIPMPTTVTTTARGLLMPRLLPPLSLPLLLRLMPMLSMVSTDMAFPMPAMDTDLPTTTDMPTTDTTDIPIPMATSDTMARGLLMLSPLLRPMLMLTTDTTAMPTPTDTAMPTVPMDTTATPTATDSDTTDKM